jgi:hypothetical protein
MLSWKAFVGVESELAVLLRDDCNSTFINGGIVKPDPDRPSCRRYLELLPV